MGHYARVDKGIVQEVIVAEAEFIENTVFDVPGSWIQCSYNTVMGIHYDSMGGDKIPSEDQSKALRKNYPGVEWNYDEIADAFYPPKSLFPNSFILNPDTYMWVAPVEYPNDSNSYIWNEDNIEWEILPENDSWMEDTYQG